MKFCFRNKTAFWFCFLGILTFGSCNALALGRESKGEGVVQDRSYDDPMGEFTGQEKRTLAYRPEEDLENDDVSEDEPENDVKTRGSKAWLLNALDKYRNKDENLNGNDDDSQPDSQPDNKPDSQPINGETKEDQQALRREQEENRRQTEAKKREEVDAEDYIPIPGQLFEGDMVMSDHFHSHLTSKNSKRDALADREYLWAKREDGTVRVPYAIDKSFSKLKRKRLKEAIADFKKYTCIRFEAKEEWEQDYVFFFSNESMCYSSVGKQLGKQKISIGDGCERKGTVIHEMLHSIGFIHEQSRPDRDKFVKVVWKNIRKRLVHNFEKYNSYLVDNLGVGYDFDSVLHYHNRAFTKNGGKTLIDKDDPKRMFGQRIGFSKKNIIQVNKLYGCKLDPSVMDDIQYE